jgi:hypothetical protein
MALDVMSLPTAASAASGAFKRMPLTSELVSTDVVAFERRPPY